MPIANCQLKKPGRPHSNRQSAIGNRQCAARIWTTLVFALTAIAVVLLVCLEFLRPAVDAWNHADTHGRKMLAAVAMLLAGVLLFFLLVMSWLAIRFARPRKPAGKTVTKYIDAWTESGKRMKTPPQEDEQ